jgi:Phage tail tube, TTP, lambda-like
MSQRAIKSQKSQIYIAYGSGSSWSLITLQNISAAPGIGNTEAAKLDVTDLDSNAREYIKGLQDSGTLAMNFFQVPNDADQIALRALEDSGRIQSFLVGLSDGVDAPEVNATTGVITVPTDRSYYRFDAYVSSITVDLAVDAPVSGTLTLQLSGRVVFTPKTV